MHEHAIEHGADFADMAFDVLQDAFFDTLYLIPFLFVTYLFMEWLEHKTGSKAQEAIRRAGVGGPALGALLGVVRNAVFLRQHQRFTLRESLRSVRCLLCFSQHPMRCCPSSLQSKCR